MTVDPNTQTGSKKEAVKDKVENSGDTGETVRQGQPGGMKEEEEEEEVCADVGESSGLGSVGCEEHLG